MTRGASNWTVVLSVLVSGGFVGVASTTIGRAADEGSITPSNASVPQISGDLAVAGRLSASTGTWSSSEDLSYSYQWQVCIPACGDIPGATSEAYSPGASDLGRQLRVIVTATGADGGASAASSLTARVAPSASVVQAGLLAQLVPPDPPLTVSLELQTRGYGLPLRILTPGRVVVEWYLGSQPVRMTSTAGRVLVASGARRFPRVDESQIYPVAEGRVTLKATRLGRSLVRRSRSLTLTAVATFTPDRSTRVSVSRSFAIS
jgi:hypothetical protein